MLKFAQTLRQMLERSGKYRVALTRSEDTFVALSERVKFSRAQGASLFMSIHADSIPRSERAGGGRHRLHLVGERLRRRSGGDCAEPRTDADAIAGVDLTAEPDDVANILVDLAQRETKTYSTQCCSRRRWRVEGRGSAAQKIR